MSIVLTEPTAYIYNGYRLPELTFLDTYPYVIIYQKSLYSYTAYCSTQALTIGVSSSDSTQYTLVQKGKRCDFNIKTRTQTSWQAGTEYETEWTGNLTGSFGTPIWSTHKITYPNGTTYIAVSKAPSALYEGNTEVDDCPIDLYSFTVGLTFSLVDGLGLIDSGTYINDDEPVDQWELLYEGQLTTSEKLDVENGYYVEIPYDINTPILSEAGEGIRLTINGVSKIYTTIATTSLGTAVSIGNKWLMYLENSVGVEDDGDDFYLQTLALFGYETRLYTRYPGVYNVKIERALFDPVAYLYNGVRLPVLPEWDENKYPYAMIGLKDINKGVAYSLYVTDTEVYFGNTNTLNLFPYGGYTASSWTYYPDDPNRPDWVPGVQDIAGAKWSFDTDYGLTWSSFDVYRVGELYCAKSEPIPVYE